MTTPIVLRLPGLHGQPRKSGIVHRLTSAAVSGSPVDLSEPETRLSFLWVEDAARVAVAAACGQMAGRHPALNIASGAFSLRELATKISETLGRPIDIRAGNSPARNRVLDVSRMKSALPFDIPRFEDRLASKLSATAS